MQQKLFKEIVAKTLNTKATYPRVSKYSKQSMKNSIPSHVTIKLLKTIDKYKILKASRVKQYNMQSRTKNDSQPLGRTMHVRRQLSNTFKILST